MYADRGPALDPRIAVTAQDDRLGYRLREQLEDALAWDRGPQPLYRLTTVTQQSRRPLGRRIDDTATRYELTVRVAWTLTPASGRHAPDRGRDRRPPPMPPPTSPMPPSPPSRTARTAPPRNWPV